jgi:hypothetical protein
MYRSHFGSMLFWLEAVFARMLLNWLILVETQLAFAELERSELWADSGDVDLKQIVSTVKSIRASEADDRLKGTARAYALIREVVKNCTQTKHNCSNATRAILRKWRDVTTCHCACVVGVASETMFLHELDSAFGGQVLGNRDLSSQMLQSYAKILADYDGAFDSRNTQLVNRRGWVRPRAPKGKASSEAHGSAAAASTDSADVGTQTVGVECVYEDGVCRLLGAPDVWETPSFSSAHWHDLQCEYGHTVQQEHFFGARDWRCPVCSMPLYVLRG